VGGHKIYFWAVRRFDVNVGGKGDCVWAAAWPDWAGRMTS